MVHATNAKPLIVLVGTMASACAVPPTPIPQVDSESEVTVGPTTSISGMGSTIGPLDSTTLETTSTSATSSTTSDPTSLSPTTSDSTTSPIEPASTSTSSDGSTTSSVLSVGSTTGESEGTTGPVCALDLIDCGGECIDPASNLSFCGAVDPCDVNPGDVCDPLLEICLAGVCENCELRYNFEFVMPVGSLATWILQPDWEVRDDTPPSTNAPVNFASYALGTDGNRQAPYPGLENETSQVTTGTITFGDTLSFYSWHVDEGGDNPSGWDNKIIEINNGVYETLVNCESGVNPQSFCQQVQGPRAADDWDLIVLDTSMYSGYNTTLRITYQTNKLGNDFEQGWYIDDIRVGVNCGPPT